MRFWSQPARPDGRAAIALLPVRTIERDERLGRRILLRERHVVVERRCDLLGKLLAQLDAPLVEGIKPPHRALDKDDVLVERDELAERVRVQLDAKDGRGRTVAGKAARGHHPLGSPLRSNLVGSLSKGESLGLREEVGEEQLVHVLLAVLGNIRVAYRAEPGVFGKNSYFLS